MLDVFAEVIAPVLVVALVGGWVCRRLGVPDTSVSTLSFFLFSPALVFSSMSTIELEGSNTGAVALVAAGTSVATCVVALVVATVFGFDARTRAAVGLTAGISNGGNLGLPVAALAFGSAGLEVAVVAFVTGSLLANTLGVFVASSAAGRRTGTWRSLGTVPSLWAAGAGLAVNALDVDLPAVVSASTATLGDAAIPVMLVVLGLQISLPRDGDGAVATTVSVVVRLVLGPLAAWFLAEAAGLDGVVRDTLVVLGGMPAAVYTTILATQYGARPGLVTRIVVLGTVGSMVTLTILVAQYR